MFGYTGKILHYDLTTQTHKILNTKNYVPKFIGGYGLALKLLWDETVDKPFPTEFSPAAPLIFATGPNSGTPALTSGRCEAAGIAPQGFPVPWVADSGFGGDFACKLKFAGYDAIVLIGKAEKLSYLYIDEDESKIELRDALKLKGLSTKDTQIEIQKDCGKDTAVAAIGVAGENLVRFAIILTKSKNASGQGGFGATMGSKNLKAIVIKPGLFRVSLANPNNLLKEVRIISDELHCGNTSGYNTPTTGSLYVQSKNNKLPYRKTSGCTSCSGCGKDLEKYYENVPLQFSEPETVASGVLHCVGGSSKFLLAKNESTDELIFEISKLCDWLGLNHWEMFCGMNWFIQNSYNNSKLSSLLDTKLDLNKQAPFVGFSPQLAIKFIKAIANRQGDGDIFAEGTPRAAIKLNITDEFFKTHKHGYGPHWDGRNQHKVHFPLWVTSALLWSIRGRDPFNSTHGSIQNYHKCISEWGEKGNKGPVPYSQIENIGEKIYNTKYAFSGWPDDEDYGYIDKEKVAIWHEHRSMLKCSVTVCDQPFPITWNWDSETVSVGDIDAELRMFNAVTGLNWTSNEMNTATERCWNLLRAIHVRQGRTRESDESIIPYFVQKTEHENEINELNPEKFKKLLDNYYLERGWDIKTGWPTQKKLIELDLNDIASSLENEGKLPQFK